MSFYERIENDFIYHAPDNNDIKRHSAVREAGRLFAHVIDELVPDGREKSLALTKIEEAVHWANAGIAREE